MNENGQYPNETTPPQESHSNGQQAFVTLGQFLEADGWFPQRLPDKLIYRCLYSGKNGEYRCYANIRVEFEQFLFYVVANVRAPENTRPAVAEFLTRANFGLRIGNFELDYSDGEIRYKTSLDFEGEALTPNFIRNALYPAVQNMDRYFAGLLHVMYGGRLPAEVIAEIETT